MSVLPILTIADKVHVYDVDRVQRVMDFSSGGRQEMALQRIYQKMLNAGSERFVTKPSSVAGLEGLALTCPNFTDVLHSLSKAIELSLFGRSPLSFMPVLLTGDPGVGKTHFAKQLAEGLGVKFRFVSMGSMTASFVLSGAAPTWTGAKQGKIADALVNDEFANPLFLLDEIDKCAASTQYDPYGVLLQLLEQETSSHFADEYLDVELNASCVLWVATANDPSRIPDYILNRMAVFEVPAPTAAQAAVIARNVYTALLASNGWPFTPILDAAVLEILARVPPREMKKQLLDALGSARLARRDHLIEADVDTGLTRRTRPIGFIN